MLITKEYQFLTVSGWFQDNAKPFEGMEGQKITGGKNNLVYSMNDKNGTNACSAVAMDFSFSHSMNEMR